MSRKTKSLTLEREDKARVIALIVASGFAAAVAQAYFCGAYLGQAFPRNTFLYLPDDVGNDFFFLFKSVQSGFPYRYKWSQYLPFNYIPLVLLSVFPDAVAYWSCFGIFSLFVFYVIFKQLNFLPLWDRFLVGFILCFLTYPYLFLLDRGNLEAFIFVALGLFLLCYQRDFLRRSVFFLACASAMKLYPLVFGVLLFKRRKYLCLLATVVIIAALTLASASFFPEGIVGSYQAISARLITFRDVYLIGDRMMAYTSGYFTLLKLVAAKIYPLSPDAISHLLPIYTVAALALFGAIALYIVFWEEEFWKMVALLTAMIILLPQISNDYKLIHLLFPTLLFIASERKCAFDWAYAAIFGLLLIPKAFYWIQYKDNVLLVPISNILNPLLMTVLIGLIISERLFIRSTVSDHATS